jgi:hypothetical protein
MNRANDNGKLWSSDVNDVLSQKSQFAAPIDMSKVTPAEYSNAVKLATQAYYRTVDDPTLGSTYFWNPVTANQAAVKNIAATETFNKKIGNHVFYGKADLGPLITPTPNQYGRYLADLPGLSDEDRAALVNPTVLADARRAAGDTDVPAGYVLVADKDSPVKDSTPTLQFAGIDVPPVLASILPTGIFGSGTPSAAPATPAPPMPAVSKAAPPAPSAPTTPLSVPKGKYGEDRIVQAILDNDPVALAAAKENTMKLITAHPLRMQGAINEVQKYFQTTIQGNPALAVAVKENWTANPKLKQTLPAPVVKMTDDMLAGVTVPEKPVAPPPVAPKPIQIAANVPLPRLRPLVPPVPAVQPLPHPVSRPMIQMAPALPGSRSTPNPSPPPRVGNTVPSTSPIAPPLSRPIVNSVPAPRPVAPSTVVSNSPVRYTQPVRSTVLGPALTGSQDSESTTGNPGLAGDSTAPGTGLGSALSMSGAGAGVQQQIQQQVQRQVQRVVQAAPAMARGGNVQQAVQGIMSRIGPLTQANGGGSYGVTPVGGQPYVTRSDPSTGGQVTSWYSSSGNPITVHINSQGEATSTNYGGGSFWSGLASSLGF